MTASTYRYPPQFGSVTELQQWCDEHGMRIVFVEQGPDGLLRGVTEHPDDPAAKTIAEVCCRYRLTREQLLGDTRHEALARARWVAMRVLELAGWDRGRIGRALGRERTTVIHGVRRCAQDPGLEGAAQAIAVSLFGERRAA